MQTSDYRWRLDTRLLVWCLATRLCDRLLNVNSSGEWSSHSSFYFVAQPFFRSNSLVEEGSRSCFWSSFVKGNRCRKIWCKKSAEKSFSEHILALSIMYTFTYVSIAFFLSSERTFVQSMIHNGLSIVKISEEFLGYLGFYWEWKMDVLYVFLYILIFFFIFSLFICLFI